MKVKDILQLVNDDTKISIWKSTKRIARGNWYDDTILAHVDSYIKEFLYIAKTNSVSIDI